MSAQSGRSHLAFDLGASTSRAFLGTLNGDRLEMEELHRFTTPVLEVGGHLYWDIEAMWAELQTGLDAARAAGPRLGSLSVDSWAVDYVPIDADGIAMRNPYCYRDQRTDGVMQQVLDVVPASEIYSATGIQFLPFNTLYQLLADAKCGRQAEASCHLPIADYFNFRVSGHRAVEVSMASTTQLMEVGTRRWSHALMNRFELDPFRWPEIVRSGTRLGPSLLDPTVEVLATCSHDTASAVAAAPAVHPAGPWAFVSCGTWSLMGVERSRPLLTNEALESGFTNEAGLDDTIRFLKNLTGLWVLQECVREWRTSSPFQWSDLEREARAAMRATAAIRDPVCIDLEDSRFLPRGPMEERIRAYCRERGLPALRSRGEIVLAILSSIAVSYGATLAELERVTGTQYERIYLFGGGSQNALLCELTATACRRDVVAGPVEATAMGNLLIQARTMKDLPAGASVRDLSAASADLWVYSPNPAITGAVPDPGAQRHPPSDPSRDLPS